MAALHQLFQWGIENQSPSDHSSIEPKKQLTSFDRNFLNAAMRSDASKMKGLLDIYQAKDSSLEEKEIALEDLEFFVQTIDNACDLSHSTVNGLTILLDAVKYERKENVKPDFSQSSQVRMRAAWVLATALQNNPKLQLEAQKHNALHILTEILNQEISFLSSFTSKQPINEEDITEFLDRGDLQLISKLVFAISALIENKPAIKQFREENGFHSLNVLLRLEKADIIRISKIKDNLIIKREKELYTQKEDEILIERIDKQIEEDNKKDGSDIVEVEDDVKNRARHLQKTRALIRMGIESQEQASEDEYSLWLRCSRRTLFILKKLMDNHEEIKYAFIKDQDSETVKTISNLLACHNQDLDLREKCIFALSCLFLGENPLQKQAIRDLKINHASLVQELLQNLSQIKNLDDGQSGLPEQINQIIVLLGMQ